MKKSVRPAVSKVSGDRGKSEIVSSAGTGKSAGKSITTAPLSKVKLITWPIDQLICLNVI